MRGFSDERVRILPCNDHDDDAVWAETDERRAADCDGQAPPSSALQTDRGRAKEGRRCVRVLEGEVFAGICLFCFFVFFPSLSVKDSARGAPAPALPL